MFTLDYIELWLLTEPNTLIPIQVHKYWDKYIDTETNTYIQNNVTCRPRPSKSLAVCLFVRFGGRRTVAHCSTRIKIILLIKLLLLGPRSFCRSSCCYYDQDHCVDQVAVNNFESDTDIDTYCDTNINNTLMDLLSCQLKSRCGELFLFSELKGLVSNR